MLSTYNRTFEDASMECKLSGGSLATYRSLALQQEVEKYYIDQGLLFPLWHKVSLPGLALHTAGQLARWPRNFYRTHALLP